MKVIIVLICIAVLIWTIANIIYDVHLAGREANLNQDRVSLDEGQRALAVGQIELHTKIDTYNHDRDTLKNESAKLNRDQIALREKRKELDEQAVELAKAREETAKRADELIAEGKQLKRKWKDFERAQGEFADQLASLEERERKCAEMEALLKDRKADVQTRECILGLMGVPEAADIVEPAAQPEVAVKPLRKRSAK